MIKYKYTVINQENKQLDGIISAIDENAARKELNDLGFAIISIQKTTEETFDNTNVNPETPQQIPVFEFSAIDKNNRRIIGTIQSQDRYSAFRRLIDEYAFKVEYIVDNNLDEASKEQAKMLGVLDLNDKLQEESLAKTEKTPEDTDLKEFEIKHAILNEQVNFVLERVKEIIETYGPQLKQETKEKIKYFVDKILRIRSSTNLEYIKQTAEELLTFLQKEELFINESQNFKEKTQILVEAKGMMLQLKKQKNDAEQSSLLSKYYAWKRKKFTDEKAASTTDRLIRAIAETIFSIPSDTPEALEAQQQLQELNNQLKRYAQLYFQAPSPEFKAETVYILKKLWNQRKAIKQKIKLLAQTQRQNDNSIHPFQLLYEEFFSLSGWLLCFYLIYYFVSIYISTKNLTTDKVPFIFYIYNSSFLKYFLTTVFLLHIGISIKESFFKKNHIATAVIIPITLFALLVTYINL